MIESLDAHVELSLEEAERRYHIVKEQFEEEFTGFLPVEVVENPQTVASVGYYHHAMSLGGGTSANSIGLDIGNSSTIVTYHKNA